MANWRNPIGRSTQDFLTTYPLSNSTEPLTADPVQLAPDPLSQTGSEPSALPPRILDPRDQIRSSGSIPSVQTVEIQVSDPATDPTQEPETSRDRSGLDLLNPGSELDLEAAQPPTLEGSSFDLSSDPLPSESLASESLASDSLASDSLASDSLASESLTSESLASESLVAEVALVPDQLRSISGTGLWQDPVFQSGITAGILLLVAIGLFWLNTWIERNQLDQPAPFSSQLPSSLATAEDWDES